MPSKARSSTKRRDEKPGRRREDRPGRRIKKKVCYFCAEGIEHVDYKDVALLRKFMSDRAKIRSSRVTGNCVQHQRRVAQAIKNARELALLPYTNR
jgi:ribosomal protein S18